MFHITPLFPAIQPSPRLRPAGRSGQRLFQQPPAESRFLATRNLVADPNQAERLTTLRTDFDAWMRQQGDTHSVFVKPSSKANPPR